MKECVWIWIPNWVWNSSWLTQEVNIPQVNSNPKFHPILNILILWRSFGGWNWGQTVLNYIGILFQLQDLDQIVAHNGHPPAPSFGYNFACNRWSRYLRPSCLFFLTSSFLAAVIQFELGHSLPKRLLKSVIFPGFIFDIIHFELPYLHK